MTAAVAFLNFALAVTLLVLVVGQVLSMVRLVLEASDSKSARIIVASAAKGPPAVALTNRS